MSDFAEVWKVNEKDFPKNGSPADKLAFCVRYAVLAPSPYNTQPWFFRIKANTVFLYADRRQSLPVIDPEDRALTIGCAAALYNMRLAIRHFGYDETTEILPDPDQDDLLAQITLGDAKDADPEEDILFECITKRRVNRGAFADKEVPKEILNELKDATADGGAWLHIAAPLERKVIISMIVEGDHMQCADRSFRRELASWASPMRNYSGDGMPQYGLSYSQIMNTMVPQVIRRFEDANHEAAADDALDDGSPVIAILGSRSGGQMERINAGQAMMRMLLTAEKLGLSVSPLNQPLEIPDLRLRLHEEVEHAGRAQMIFRMGYGGKPAYQPRRPLEAVVKIDGKKGVSAVAANDKAEKTGWIRKLLAKSG